MLDGRRSKTQLNEVEGSPDVLLAFSSAGDLFVANSVGYENNDILEITPGGVQSTFASGLDDPEGLAFQGEVLPVPEPSTLGSLAVGLSAFLVRRRKLCMIALSFVKGVKP